MLLPLVQTRLLDASTDPEVLGEADAVIVCVPTPLNKTKEPDMRFIVVGDATRSPRTSTPTCSSSSSRPPTRARRARCSCRKLTHGRLEVGQDVFVAFSPERVDPGNAKYHTQNTPKVIGGIDAACLDGDQALYGEDHRPRSCPSRATDAAEMVKLLENTFRAVNIGLVNEVAIMSRRLGIDAWEVIRAAATKPFGFMPFYPGPGLGGHCIPVDPLYLSWKLRRSSTRRASSSSPTRSTAPCPSTSSCAWPMR